MIEFKTLKLADITPPNLMRDEKVANITSIITEHMADLINAAYTLNYSMHVNDLPESIIDHLLWENHMYNPSEGLVLADTLEKKRQVLNRSIELHRTKGTPHAIELVLQTINLNGEVLEWFQYEGQPYHFQVEVNVPVLSKETLLLLRQLINEYKNKRSWLEFIAIKVFSGNLKLAASSYEFPVTYPICNMFQTDTLPGKLANGNISMGSNSYTFDTSSPICNTFITATVNSAGSRLNVELANEYRNVDVLYHRASQNIVVGEGEI